ncbi:hypothetical protein MAM1_1177d11494 [Mucor ambiguus]|uniref:Retrotransposon gag domain-containing protein n=1 Tax=Mucor ambiguus TaxID=91626 RepID=A0A0C9NAR9_9FUNG|nr:hypothetical protein MAM1_1177d11494 [Mucor ambiguus]
MDVDMDFTATPVHSVANADNPTHLQELQSTATQLTRELAAASAKLPSLHGEARQVAVQEIQDLALTIKASNDLLASFALQVSDKEPLVVAPGAALIASTAPISPGNLPYFQWEGAIFDTRVPWSVDVDACLTNFEDVMNFYSINFDKEFRRLVPPMLSPTQRTWYQSFLTSHELPTWLDFKSSFKARYGISVLDDRQKCAASFMNISFGPNESLASFVDRFNDLRRRAFDQLPQL